jgi:ammonia channel protein AmtB
MRSSFDPSQIFAGHAIGGIVGNLLTGIFAQKSIAGSDGSAPILGGWLAPNYKQLGIQLADSATGVSYTFVVTVSPSMSVSRRTIYHPRLSDYHFMGHASRPMVPPPHHRGGRDYWYR